MTSYINLFLKTELTCIPKLLKNYIGNYYNNALCNGATWVFVLWCILHIIFDKVTDAFLKKVRYKEYVRLRLTSSLWYLGFYGTALTYCGLTMAQNEMELFNFKKMHVPTRNDIPAQVMGYTLISTFYLHSAFWEALTKESFSSMFSYLFLFTFLVSSYILRIVEISFTLTAIISLPHVLIEMTRCGLMISNPENIVSKVVMRGLYTLSVLVYFASYIVVIPLTFIAPLGLKILTDYPNILLLFLFFNLVCWIITDIYQSVLFKSIDHGLYHCGESVGENPKKCLNGFLECSLFKPRDDVSYNIQILREEIKARETKMMSLRKPKNKSMLIQTLKCMVAIKRKLSEKRLSESSDSDDSEKSEDSGVKTNEKTTDDETVKLQSDEDESGDEESESQDTITEDININNNDGKPVTEELIDLNTPDATEEYDKETNSDLKQNDKSCDIKKDILNLKSETSVRNPSPNVNEKPRSSNAEATNTEAPNVGPTNSESTNTDTINTESTDIASTNTDLINAEPTSSCSTNTEPPKTKSIF